MKASIRRAVLKSFDHGVNRSEAVLPSGGWVRFSVYRVGVPTCRLIFFWILDHRIDQQQPLERRRPQCGCINARVCAHRMSDCDGTREFEVIDHPSEVASDFYPIDDRRLFAPSMRALINGDHVAVSKKPDHRIPHPGMKPRRMGHQY